jgi:hypothetical protein
MGDDIANTPQRSEAEPERIVSGREIFDRAEKELGQRIAGQIVVDGVNVFMKRMEAIKQLVTSPDSMLANRIEKIIHDADPEANIRFQTFEQWAPQHKDDPIGKFGPIAIHYQGNLPADIEDRIQAEIKRTLDSVMPGLSQKYPDITVYLEQLPREIEGAPN